jgi:hypothetical protein
MVAFVGGLWFAATVDDAMQKKRAATGIIFIGIEREPNYFDIAHRRIEDALAKEKDNEQ